jgi:hypothetical protein
MAAYHRIRHEHATKVLGMTGEVTIPVACGKLVATQAVPRIEKAGRHLSRFAYVHRCFVEIRLSTFSSSHRARDRRAHHFTLRICFTQGDLT